MLNWKEKLAWGPWSLKDYYMGLGTQKAIWITVASLWAFLPVLRDSRGRVVHLLVDRLEAQSCVVTHTHTYTPHTRLPTHTHEASLWLANLVLYDLCSLLSVWIVFPPLLSPRIIQNRILIVILGIVLVITILTAITFSVRGHWCICSSLINSDHGSFWVIKTKWAHESFSCADRLWMTLPLSLATVQLKCRL